MPSNRDRLNELKSMHKDYMSKLFGTFDLPLEEQERVSSALMEKEELYNRIILREELCHRS